MVVALGAVGGEAEVDPAHGLHAIGGVVGEVLLDDGTALVGGDVAALQAGRDELVFGGLGQEVAGELFDGELIEGLVAIEGLHDPVAIGPHLAVSVEVQSVRVGVARGIEPVAGAVLAVGGGGEEFVDQRIKLRVAEAGVRLRSIFGEQFGRRRQAGEVEADTTHERRGVGFRRGLESVGGELGGDEAVDGVLGPGGVGDFRQRGLLRGDERPVRLPGGALFDPALDQRDLGGLEGLVLLGRRHDLLFVLGDDALEERALVRLALDDGRRFFLAVLGHARCEEAGFGIEAEARLAGGGIGAVAVEAVFGHDRADVAVELDLLFGREGGGREKRQERQEGLTHGEGCLE